MANIDKKPHIYRINGKWYCRQRHEAKAYGWCAVRTALGAARDTPVGAFLAWLQYHSGAKTCGLRLPQ